MMLPDAGMTLYVGAIGLVAIGVTGIVVAKNLYRILLALVIAEAGANLLLVLSGFRFDAIAPIITQRVSEQLAAGQAVPMVDPVPQALVLTSIVIGVGIQALALSLIIRVYKAYATLDIREISRQLERDISKNAGVLDPVSEENPQGGRPLSSPAGTNPVVSHQGVGVSRGSNP